MLYSSGELYFPVLLFYGVKSEEVRELMRLAWTSNLFFQAAVHCKRRR